MNQATEPQGNAGVTDENAQRRIDELEMRTVFMEDTIEALSRQLADITQEFALAKQAMQLLNSRLEQVQGGGQIKNPADETPPPHY